MHRPNPLGTYPLELRDHDISSPRLGEILMDYETSNIYYINKDTGEKIPITKEIYDDIVNAKLNTIKIDRVKASSDVESDLPAIPSIDDRKVSHFYFSVIKK